MPEHTPAPSPSRAVYGFALYLSFNLFFIIYTTWALMPEEWFRSVGITCLPQRYWAVTVPIFLLTVLAVFAFVIYPSLGLLMTPNVDELRTIHDSVGIKTMTSSKSTTMDEDNAGDCCCVDKSRCFKAQYEIERKKTADQSIPMLRDLNIWDVSDHLYLKLNK